MSAEAYGSQTKIEVLHYALGSNPHILQTEIHAINRSLSLRSGKKRANRGQNIHNFGQSGAGASRGRGQEGGELPSSLILRWDWDFKMTHRCKTP